jgi:hypothetical protein
MPFGPPSILIVFCRGNRVVSRVEAWLQPESPFVLLLQMGKHAVDTMDEMDGSTCSIVTV